MRTSHILIKKQIHEKKQSITDKIFFSSEEYKNYLLDIAESVTKRYKRELQIITYWNEDEDFAASTNNQIIHINCGNEITESFPTRKFKSDSIIGFLAHECGHILFTDFLLSNEYTENIINNGILNMFQSEKLLDEKETKILNEIQNFLKTQNKEARNKFAEIAHTIHNVLEDGYIEWKMCNFFSGTMAYGIHLKNYMIQKKSLSIAQQIKNKYTPLSIIINCLIQNYKTKTIKNPESIVLNYNDKIKKCISIAEKVIYNDNHVKRLQAVNRIIIICWEYIKSLLDNLNSNELSQTLNQETNGSSTPKGNQKSVEDNHSNSKNPSESSQTPNQQTNSSSTPKGNQKSVEDNHSNSENSNELNKTYQKIENSLQQINNNSDTSLEPILNKIAQKKVCKELEKDLENKLQKEADNTKLSSIDKDIRIKVNRKSDISNLYIKIYNMLSRPLLTISKQLSKQIKEVIEEKEDYSRQNGFYTGKKIDIKSVILKNDGKIFYKYNVPEYISLAVVILIDQSGSMDKRIETAKQASIIVYEFCKTLNIPLLIQGHYFSNNTVYIDSYVEFDSVDNNDKYRLMELKASGMNRDSAAIKYTLKRLIERNEETKLFILISDGLPTAYSSKDNPIQELQNLRKEYIQKGILFFTAAIGDDKERIKYIYKDSFLDITDIKKLPFNLINLIKRFLY